MGRQEGPVAASLPVVQLHNADRTRAQVPMKIVVTGAAGFIGSHLCERLVRDGHEVVGIDNFDDFLYPAQDKRRCAQELVAATIGADFRLLRADICDGAAMAELIAPPVDLVCHFAALAGVRPSLRAPEKYMRTNVEGTSIVLESCRRADIKKVIFASSSSVYGTRTGEEAFLESDPCLLQASPYAASKRSGELLCGTYHELYGLGISCLRFFTVFGPRQRPDMAIHRFLQAVARGQPITLFGDGRSRRDYTYIDDIVDGVVGAIDTIREGSFNVFNLGGSTTTELRELVSLIEDTVGRKAVLDRIADQPGDVPLTFADIRAAQSAFGYQPRVGLRDGLKRHYEYYLSHAKPAAALH